jgi:porin
MSQQITVFCVGLAFALAGLGASGQAGADDAAADKASDKNGTPASRPGIVPIPNYGGGLGERAYLLGDFGGRRTEWANNGFQFDVDTVSWADSVIDGGQSGATRFGANLTYNFTIDLMRAGIVPGAMIQVRAESLVGDKSASANTGQLTPANTASLSPTNYNVLGAGYDLALSQLSWLQMFSERFGVIFGKLDLYGDGAPSEFAGGRGRTQFMNWSLNYPTPALYVPSSTLGAGVVVLPNRDLSITSLLLSGTQCANSDCFEDLDDKGGIWATNASYQYRLRGLPGGVNGSFTYFFDKDFTELGSVTFVSTEGLKTSTKRESWIVGGSFWQYLSVKGTHEGPVNLTNKVPDLQGWGIFGSLTFADNRTNPWKTSLNLGVGGRGIISKRPNDLYGMGYFYNDLEKTLIEETANFDDHGQGVEAFYNLAITNAIRLSANVQYLSSVDRDIDDSLYVAGRLQVLF